ncbi:MAG: hypothetical protein RMK84_12515 [Oscillochloridaceae bacterium]|nr:hypothetical protein [Chloroflexaceae bacterium]MDW8390942.1 hypothetical protein [Oscillochloridaceae bacterium]
MLDTSLLAAGTFPFVFLVVSIIIDALILFQTRWADLKGSFRDSLIANLISAVVIVLLSRLILSVPNIFLALLLALLIAWIAEGFVLALLRRTTFSRGYLAALVANFSAFIFAYAYVATFALMPL